MTLIGTHIPPKFHHRYQCGSCGRKFGIGWSLDTEDTEDVSTCPCDVCGAQAVSIPRPTFQIFRESLFPKNLIGNLPLKTIKEIHSGNIKSVDFLSRIVIVNN
jgi:DNA-directed RNA polymerase subunit RPC12/RpoP